MKEWTREERYRPLAKEDEPMLKELHESIKKSIWRCQYHVQTVTGLLGDTNGFSWYNGKWHLFYQWFPYGGVHGLKHWYHVESEDLVHWKNVGVGIIAEGKHDDYGAFSGSGFVEDDILYLPYTGNHRDKDWVRYPTQLLAYMTPDGKVHKQDEPLYEAIEGYSEHQRDPKMFYRPEDGYYYFMLGVQNLDKKGKFLLMRSKSIKKDWQVYGEMKVRGYEDFGFMVECPALEKVGDKWLLVFSPQGLQPDGDNYQNIYNNTYFIGDMDFENLEFIPDGPFKELDRGFDFYAAQCAFQDQFKNQAVLCAWFGVSDYEYPPTVEQDYSGLQTMARILSIENGALKQRPAPAALEIKGEILYTFENETASKDMPRACVIEVQSDNNDLTLDLFKHKDHSGFVITYNSETSTLSIDRGSMENQLNIEYGTVRRVHLEKGLQDMTIFVDHSSIEIFVNDGDIVSSSRIFPTMEENQLVSTGQGNKVVIYAAKNTVEDNFVIYPENK